MNPLIFIQYLPTDWLSHLAITQSRYPPFQTRNATRSFGENQPKFYYGVSRIWNHLVGLASRYLPPMRAPTQPLHSDVMVCF